MPTAVYNAAAGCISRDDGDGPLAPKNLSVSASSTQDKQPTFGTSGAKLAVRPVMSSSSTFLASRPAASLALRLACICGFALLALPGSALADAETDRKIERAAQSSYNFRAILNNQVQVEANDGIVTLTGVVRDQQQKSLAEVTVRELPGVISVENKLETSSPMHERADGWIALKINGL
ncbi:MAG TPA: BON domain-containing protein, partial [Opitutus sp.]|nr:BON domain-containing protein [Opitutus sp.]